MTESMTGTRTRWASPSLVTTMIPQTPMMPGNIPSSIDLTSYQPPRTYFAGSKTVIKNNPSFLKGQRKAERKFDHLKSKLE